MPLSPTKEWVLDLLLLALSPLALPWWIGLLWWPHGDFFHLGVFMRWPSTHDGSLAAFPEVGLLGVGCWRIVRVPQKLFLIPLPGVRTTLRFFGIAVLPLLQATPLTRSIASSHKPGQGLSASAFKGCSSALTASHSEVAGSHVLLSRYVTLVLSRGPGILFQFLSPFLGCLSGSSELDRGSVELLQTYGELFFWFCMRSSSWPLPWLSLLVCSMLCHFVALIPGAEVRCPFLSSRASWRRIRAPRVFDC